ncbi:cbb3-type cytochrome c oxidase subunit 3 [Roseicitreum antarcticum]|uniref:Cytochrome c oxidase cbb3-type subunit 4 n=1 Tax=Roseicitreum antarcticum TaxID=564137 RepID=A0A1H2RPW9_9RHOB|nr:cbb3-type cytochrome c oxidase subunit 3 [Roseicitreum antarcticum]SDW20679.1 cytochrome c oxidase cbb3-type subunit 4 [Roseicitreum antarcticum]
METYTALRTFADSWHLLFMFVFFIAIVVYLFRPGSRKMHDETKNMIFRNDDKPDADGDSRPDRRDHSQPHEAR